MSNHHLRDKNLSLKAKGLLSQMLSLPEDWDYTIQGLCSINKEKEASINSTLNELKDNGYLKVTKKMPNETKSGRIEYVYDIYETPEQEGEKQDLENLGVEFQGVEFQGLENQGQLNTEELSTEITSTEERNKDNIKEKNIKKEILEDSNLPAKGTKKPSEKMLKEEFEEVWKKYPKREGKANAFKSYIKARKEGVPREEIEAGIERYIDMLKIRGTEVQYIKMGSTWFNQRGWEDEYSKPARKVIGTGTTNENDEITDSEPLF